VQDQGFDEPLAEVHKSIELRAIRQDAEGSIEVAPEVALEISFAGEARPLSEDGQGNDLAGAERCFRVRSSRLLFQEAGLSEVVDHGVEHGHLPLKLRTNNSHQAFKSNIPNMEKDDTQHNVKQNSGESHDTFAGGSGWTTTKSAAKALSVSRRTVQNYVRRGLLEARAEGQGVRKAFYIDIDSLNALRNKRASEMRDAEYFVGTSPEARVTTNADEAVGEALRRIAERLEARTAEAADLRARLELTARSESSLREDLERERGDRERIQEEIRTLRKELETERDKRFWKVGVVVGSIATILAALLVTFNEIFR
jgi:hypothetical protein